MIVSPLHMAQGHSSRNFSRAIVARVPSPQANESKYGRGREMEVGMYEGIALFMLMFAKIVNSPDRELRSN